jgi:hypothetical protein
MQRAKQNSAMREKRRGKTAPCSVQRKKTRASAQTKKRRAIQLAKEKKRQTACEWKMRVVGGRTQDLHARFV